MNKLADFMDFDDEQEEVRAKVIPGGDFPNANYKIFNGRGKVFIGNVVKRRGVPNKERVGVSLLLDPALVKRLDSLTVGPRGRAIELLVEYALDNMQLQGVDIAMKPPEFDYEAV